MYAFLCVYYNSLKLFLRNTIIVLFQKEVKFDILKILDVYTYNYAQT